MIPRYWEENLDWYIKSMLDVPFKWGENDCGMFVAGAVKVVLGTDIGRPYRGRYDTKAGAIEQAKWMEFDTVYELECNVLDRHMARRPLSEKLQFGDIIAAEIQNLDLEAKGPTIGVIGRDGDMLVPGADGLVSITGMKPEVIWRS